MLAQFLIYVIRGPVDPFVAAVIFVSFLFCLAPALFLLKPFENREALRRRREKARKKRERHQDPTSDDPSGNPES